MSIFVKYMRFLGEIDKLSDKEDLTFAEQMTGIAKAAEVFTAPDEPTHKTEDRHATPAGTQLPPPVGGSNSSTLMR